jgi:hypothetical protein
MDPSSCLILLLPFKLLNLKMSPVLPFYQSPVHTTAGLNSMEFPVAKPGVSLGEGMVARGELNGCQ